MDRTTAMSLLLSTYVVFTLITGVEAPPWAYGALVPLALVIGLSEWATRHLREDHPSLRVALRVGAVSAALFVLSLIFIEWRVGFVFALGSAALTGVMGFRSVSLAPAAPGMVSRLHERRSYLLAHGLVLLAFAAALYSRLSEPFAGLSREEMRLLSENLASAAGLGMTGLTIALALIEYGRRRAELGARERLRALSLLGMTLFGVAVALGLLRLWNPVYVFLLTSVLVSLFACHASTAKEADTLGRGALTVTTFATTGILPTVVLAYFAKQQPSFAALCVAASALAAALAARFAPALRDRVFPHSEPWMEPFAIARRAAIQTEPDAALAGALVELSSLSHRRLESPCIFRFDPPSVTLVDLAGYVRTESAAIPNSITDIAKEETQAVLTVEALDAVAVRRPETRAVAAWMSDRKLRAVALAFEGDTAVGMLGLPLGDRQDPLALSEVRALAELTQLLGGHIATSSQIARSVAREAAHRASEETVVKELAAVQVELEGARDRSEAFVRALAARASIAAYSPTMRLALEAIDRVGASGAPLTLLDAHGTDPLPFAARYHLASERRSHQLLVFDGRDSTLADLSLWRDPAASPLLTAKGGTLLLVDAHQLPKLVQAYISAALPPDTNLCVVLPRTVDVLMAEDRLEERFADFLGEQTVALPRLAARPEDLRALALHHLTRIGLRERKKPIGIDASALEWLIEHDWPGNETELESVLIRAALAMERSSEVLTRQDLLRGGFARR